MIINFRGLIANTVEAVDPDKDQHGFARTLEMCGEEIQRAHDLLVAIRLGDIPSPFEDAEAEFRLQGALDVLCWVLGHHHNLAFQTNLDAIDEHVRELGVVVHKADRPMTAAEWEERRG